MLSATHSAPAPAWQNLIKRVVDVSISSVALVLLSPLLLFVAFRVYFSSPGPILYLQERVGYRGRKFEILKFRSMYVGSEANGPRLATAGDERITPWGRIMRKWKLDELPQLWNVLVGEMSLVGPRPEREFFISQLEKHCPSVQYLLQVKPGLTSLGMVKFGYARNLEEMSERMKYDLVYLERRSLALDMKIIVDTVKVVLAANGK